MACITLARRPLTETQSHFPHLNTEALGKVVPDLKETSSQTVSIMKGENGTLRESQPSLHQKPHLNSSIRQGISKFKALGKNGQYASSEASQRPDASGRVIPASQAMTWLIKLPGGVNNVGKLINQRTNPSVKPGISFSVPSAHPKMGLPGTKFNPNLNSA